MQLISTSSTSCWKKARSNAGSTGTSFSVPTRLDSRPEKAGIGVAMIGSFYMMLVVLLLSLPIGVAASIYLEEFAPKNRFTDLIEVNIANPVKSHPSCLVSLVLRSSSSLHICRNPLRWWGPRTDPDDPADDHHLDPRCA